MNTNNYGLRVEYVEYTVKKGDTLYNIAKANKTTVAELTDINMLTSTTLYPGQILLVPKDSTPSTDYYFENYTTRRGDTIERIAEKQNSDPVTLGLYNDFAKLVLADNQTIKIPRSNVYVVKNTDTVDSVLANTKRTCDQILRANASSWFKTGNQINL